MSYTVEEYQDGRWVRHALAHWWAILNDARQQMDDLMHKHPTTTFRIVNNAGHRVTVRA